MRNVSANEAGMGTATQAAATAAVSHPVKQGLVQSFSIYIDTFCVCTSTAFIILMTDCFNVMGNDGILILNNVGDIPNGPMFTQLTVSTVFPFGDEVVIGVPCFTNYFGQVISNGGTIVIVPLKESDGFALKVRELEKVVTEKTKVILINFPSNPLGSNMDKEELEELARFIIEKDLYVITDEVYQNYIYGADKKFVSIAALDGMKERTVIVDSFSKAYAMTGWRIGFAAAPAVIINLMVKSVEVSVSCVNAPAQFAAIEALEGPQDDVTEMISVFQKRRDILYDELCKIDKLSCLKPAGAFYFFINITQTGLSSEEFAIRLLKEQKVAVIPGTGFGDAYGEGYVRLAYVKSEEDIQKGIERIKKFVETL